MCGRRENVLVPQCRCASGDTVTMQPPPQPSPTHHPWTPQLLHYDITLRRPSQPRLVGSDERVSQLVPRSHVIRGDVAASAAGWAGALHSLIRRLKEGGGEGMSVCMCLCVCALCACARLCSVLIWPQTLRKNMAVKAKRFAYRHKAPDTTHGRPRQCGRGQIGPGEWEWRWRRDRKPWVTTVLLNMMSCSGPRWLIISLFDVSVWSQHFLFFSPPPHVFHHCAHHSHSFAFSLLS